MSRENPPLRLLHVVLLLVFTFSATAAGQAQPQSEKNKSPKKPLIRGKTIDAWIKQSKQGPTLEDRHNALQVLRNDGLTHHREKTLRVFTEALSTKVPTVQSLAAAGLRRAGRPTDPQAPRKLGEIVSKDLSTVKPPLGGREAVNFGLVTRVLTALAEVGDEAEIPVLKRIAEDKRVNVILRQYASKAIRQIESRSDAPSSRTPPADASNPKKK